MEATTKIGITAISAIAVAILPIIQLIDYAEDKLDNYVKYRVDKYSTPIVKRNIYNVADSILYFNKTLEEKIAKEIHTDPEVVYIRLSEIIKKDSRYKQVGLVLDVELNKLQYMHVDGTAYRPFLDHNTGKYFFYNHNHQSDWCK